MKKILITTAIIGNVLFLSNSYAIDSINDKYDLFKVKQIIDVANNKGFIDNYFSTKNIVTIGKKETTIIQTQEPEEKCGLFDYCTKPKTDDNKYNLQLGNSSIIPYIYERYQLLYEDIRKRINKIVDKRLGKIKYILFKKALQNYKNGRIDELEKKSILTEWNKQIRYFSDLYADYIAWKSINKGESYNNVYFYIDNYKCKQKDFVIHYNGKEYCSYGAEEVFYQIKSRTSAMNGVKKFVKWIKVKLEELK